MNTKSVITFVLVTVAILAGAVGLLWKFGNAEVKPIADVAGEMRHVKGEGSVVLVEFSDLQCPACKAVQKPLEDLLGKYEGKVTFVYRHFPLTNVHKNAMAASWSAEAAYMQDKFWEFHDILFERQGEWEKSENPSENFVKYAEELGLDTTKFASDSQSQEVKDVVSADLLAATRYKLSGTPSFFVNGLPVEFNQLEAKLSELTSN